MTKAVCLKLVGDDYDLVEELISLDPVKVTKTAAVRRAMVNEVNRLRALQAYRAKNPEPTYPPFWERSRQTKEPNP